MVLNFDVINSKKREMGMANAQFLPQPYQWPRNMTDSTATLRQSSRRSLIWNLRESIRSVVRRQSKSAAIYPKRNAIIRVLKQPDDICIRRG